eukprot:TRINITY_DN3636_c1_g1_i1.p3 TRINITY_DN3636_c1_g1~~TRINITY_DN3636_c1_g1_i1.p3  ORF type:complete len:217 (-),score=-45.11 TRINITY_DN3636_c1_g1_i1:127-777(-)
MDNFSLQLRVRYTNINCLSKMFAYIIFHYIIYQYMESNTYTYQCFLVYIYVTYQYIYLLSNSYIYYFFLVFIYVIPTYSVISQQVIHKSSFITQFVSTQMCIAIRTCTIVFQCTYRQYISTYMCKAYTLHSIISSKEFIIVTHQQQSISIFSFLHFFLWGLGQYCYYYYYYLILVFLLLIYTSFFKGSSFGFMFVMQQLIYLHLYYFSSIQSLELD